MRPRRQARRPTRAGTRGQSLVELSVVIPVLLLLFMGVYSGAQLISDQQIAGQASRAGARLGAELGNAGYAPSIPKRGCQASNVDPCDVDGQILEQVTTIARGLIDVKLLDEVDIYEPCATSSSACTASSRICNSSSAPPNNGDLVSGDPVDVYKPVSGVFTLQGSAGYTLDLRSQSHPNEAVIGVRARYHFIAPEPYQVFNIGTYEYTTMCFAPLEVA